ncbi:glycoside hydrolase family 3 protein [Pseudoalteromonas sp. PA2MD11]|uniref:glycoside hydrolase family 3 protein n=1 Tax=Pseudoalteromonas sp. PA2MD11 TaxID=2785057 RepID=UPI001ADECAD0|nr:glycoside hydrolase family 3 protein [Pseudoalteromonas sp. PA2MD11]
MSIEKKVAQLIDTLPLAEKVGQLFLLAFAGKDYDYAKTLVKQFHVGGFYITDDNAANQKEATIMAAMLQQEAALRACDVPLLLAVDQEGAWGILTHHTDLGPGNLALGQVNDRSLTADMYQVYGEQMQHIGYNTLLSPCADVNANPNNPIIGLRSFGEEPVAVAQHVGAAVEGANKSGNLCCAKHFPGHGDTHSDSHQTLPSVDKSFTALMQQDLVPFKAAIEQGVGLIMTSHICYPQIDPDNPATLSKIILQDILQKQLGFKGLIITDSMNMWSMRRNYEPSEAAIKALKAGAHIVMLSEEHYENSTTPYKEIQAATIQGVIDAVNNNELCETVINDRLQHVLVFKYTHFADAIRTPYSLVNKASDIAKLAAEKAIKVLRNENGLWPLDKHQFTLAFAANPQGYDKITNDRGIGPNDPLSAQHVIVNTLKQRNTPHTLLSYQQLLAALNSEEFRLKEPLVLVTEDYPLPGESFDVLDQQNILKMAVEKWPDQLVVIGMRSDYELANHPRLKTYICAYSSRAISAEIIAKLL